MAQDIFIKINGIQGESTDDKHKDEIEVLNWAWKVHQESNMHAGSGGGSGKATVSDLEFVHLVDRASPNLMQYCLEGKHIPDATLVVRKAGGTPLEYLKLTMEDVVVTKVNPSGQVGDDARMRETVMLSFSRIKQEYKVQSAAGGSAGAVTAGYDIKQNKRI